MWTKTYPRYADTYQVLRHVVVIFPAVFWTMGTLHLWTWSQFCEKCPPCCLHCQPAIRKQSAISVGHVRTCVGLGRAAGKLWRDFQNGLNFRDFNSFHSYQDRYDRTYQYWIEKVKELLSYEEMTISEIAIKLGFSSTAHLSGQFKKITGMTPSAFKNPSINTRNSIDNI